MTNSSFFVFADDNKKVSHILGEIINAPERSYESFQKMVCIVNRFLSYR